MIQKLKYSPIGYIDQLRAESGRLSAEGCTPLEISRKLRTWEKAYWNIHAVTLE